MATSDKTLAQSIETVQTKVNQQSDSIQTNASAIADTTREWAATWSVRILVAAGGGYKFAGIGLGIEN
ncbi:phage tail tip fiber protein, partial [Pseudomonas urethralis]|uniref:phage tail tip fiber protein n=1 Tax=Pseudomonas urethralis TaxID=2740517 RepID=UPI002006F215